MAVQQLEGDGVLIDGQGRETAVRYSFDVRTEIAHHPAGYAAFGLSNSQGTITGPAGVRFPDGQYRLRTADGQVLRVQRLVPEWHILASG